MTQLVRDCSSWQGTDLFNRILRWWATAPMPSRAPAPRVDPSLRSPLASEAEARIRALFESGRLAEARNLAIQEAEKIPESEKLRKWVQLLHPLPSRSAGPASGRSRDQEEAWLRQHASDYQGQWVALAGDRLICASHEFSEVRKAVQKGGYGVNALVLHVWWTDTVRDE